MTGKHMKIAKVISEQEGLSPEKAQEYGTPLKSSVDMPSTNLTPLPIR
jgi:hypothetical protein